MLPGGGRARTTYAYDQGAPSTGAPFDLVTTKTTALCYGTATCVADDARTTTTAYDWNLRQPVTVTEDPGGLALATRTGYDPNTGQVVTTTQPAGGTTTNTPATRITVHYRPGSGSGYTECDNHAEWAGLASGPSPTTGAPNAAAC
nr:hypothetical protein GCM10020063_040590 [Dactylosporangium thailandense]